MFRFLLPNCPNKDNGKLHIQMIDMQLDKVVYYCDTCLTEWV